VLVTGEPAVSERYSQAFRDDTGESFAAITEPDIVLSGSVFARPIEPRHEPRKRLEGTTQCR
jgi:hypothetical protein